jgi:diguanylate cyclase (GGDEF)-like protein
MESNQPDPPMPSNQPDPPMPSNQPDPPMPSNQPELAALLQQSELAVRLNRQAWEIRFSNQKLSETTAQQALEQASQAQDEVQRGYALRTLGFLRRGQSNLTEALRLLDQAHEIATQNNEPPLERDALNLLASTHAIYGNMQVALEYTQTALAINKKLGDLAGQVSNLINIGLVYHTLERYDEAMSFQLEAIERAASIGDLRRISEARSNLAIVYLKTERYSDTVTTLRQALASAVELNLLDLVVRIQVNLAEGLIYLDEYKEALSLLRNAEKMFLENDIFEGMAHCRLNLGALYLRQQQSRLALEPLESGLWLCQTHGMKDLEVQFLQRIAAAHEQKHDHAAALKFHKAFYEAERELRRRETERQLNAISAQRELERARSEAELERMRRVEMGHLLSQLEWQAISDPLTGLYNRRHLESHLQKSLLEVQQEQQAQALSVAMLDVDNFKQVNDTFGHTVGDDVLKIIARLTTDSLRSKDVAARYGGEEFVLVIRANLPEAIAVCERLRQRIQGYTWEHVASNLAITVTLGVCADIALENHEKMLDTADKNLFIGKCNGKNQVHA